VLQTQTTKLAVLPGVTVVDAVGYVCTRTHSCAVAGELDVLGELVGLGLVLGVALGLGLVLGDGLAPGDALLLLGDALTLDAALAEVLSVGVALAEVLSVGDALGEAPLAVPVICCAVKTRDDAGGDVQMALVAPAVVVTA